MIAIPTPEHRGTSMVDFAEKTLGLKLTDWQKALLAAGENKPGTKALYTPKFWPDCSRCGQSMTGCYAGTPRCSRCSSTRKLNG